MIWFPCELLDLTEMSESGSSAYLKISVAVKRLDGRRLGRVEDIPVIDGAVCDESQRRLADPLPEDHILGHGCGLEFLLLFEIEDLKGARLGSQGDYLARPVHDGTVGLDRATDDIVA